MTSSYYIGNYKNWIDNDWIDYINSHNGDLLPRNIKNINDEKFIEDTVYQIAFENWEKSRVSLIAYSHHNFPFEISIPIDFQKNVLSWNFIKLKSGMMLPLKKPEDKFFKQSTRYRMLLQDYEFGHVFIVNGDLITDYKKGDVFKFNEATDWSGITNITNNTFLFFDIITS